MKIYRDTDRSQHHLSTEVKMLTALEKANVKGVPRLLKAADRVLLVSSIGTQFTLDRSKTSGDRNTIIGGPVDRVPKVQVCLSDFVELVDILEACHGAGVVHRDLKLSNFFFDPSTKSVFLNDWSCGKLIDNPMPFGGNLRLASVAVHDQLASEPPAEHINYYPTDDLEMLVHLLLVCSARHFNDKLANMSTTQLRDFWSDNKLEETFPQFTLMRNASRSKKYDLLKQLIRTSNML
jgi:hypothetical protein